jgi:beta-xylosidase
LKALPAPNLVSARNTLTQVLQGRTVRITAKLATEAMTDGQRAGLAMFGRQPSWIGVVQTRGQRQVTFAVGGIETVGELAAGSLLLRMQVADEHVRYSYSLDDGKTFRDLGSEAPMRFSWWKGGRPALFTFNSEPSATDGGSADFDWVRFASSIASSAH